jgi:hypothetical protein
MKTISALQYVPREMTNDRFQNSRSCQDAPPLFMDLWTNLTIQCGGRLSSARGQPARRPIQISKQMKRCGGSRRRVIASFLSTESKGFPAFPRPSQFSEDQKAADSISLLLLGCETTNGVASCRPWLSSFESHA